MQRFLAAVIQAAPVAFDAARTIEKLHGLVSEASVKGAKLVVLPEAFIGGYPKGLDFGVRVGSRSAEGREWFRIYYEGAIEVPSPHTAQIAEISAAHNLHLVTGIIERERGTLYCTVLFFGPDGRLLGKHRKLMPTAAERFIWGLGDRSTLPVIETELGRLGAVICWENYMPMLRMAMYSKGINLYCAPTVNDRETWLATMRHIALGGAVCVLRLPVRAEAGLPGMLSHRRQPTARRDSYSRWQLHYRAFRGGTCRAFLRYQRNPDSRN